MGGKRKDKKKQEKMSWADLTGPTRDIVKVPVDWASMMSDDDDEAVFMNIDRTNLPKAPRGPQEVPIESIPKSPPFTAYMSGIPFTANEEKVIAFFTDCKVLKVNMGSEDGRNRGNAVVEFEDRTSLINALDKNDATMGNRQVRVSLDNPRDRYTNRMNDYNRTGGGMSGSIQMASFPDDWRSNLRKRSDALPPSNNPGQSFAIPGFNRFKQDESRKSYSGRFSDDSARSGRRNDSFGGTWGGFRRERFNDNSQSTILPNRTEHIQPRHSTRSPAPGPEGVRKIDAGAFKALLSTSNDALPRSSIFGNAKPVDTSSKINATSLKMKQMKLTEKEPTKSTSDNPERQTYRFSKSEDFRLNIVSGMTVHSSANRPTPFANIRTLSGTKDYMNRQPNLNRLPMPSTDYRKPTGNRQSSSRLAKQNDDLNDFVNSDDGFDQDKSDWKPYTSTNTFSRIDACSNENPTIAFSKNRFESLRTEFSDDLEE